MNDFLNSVKEDLLDRRLLPIAALVVVALVAAVAYLVLGGGSTAGTPTAGLSAPHLAGGIAVSQAPVSASKAVAETASGYSVQRAGKTHDPFNPLPGAAKAVSSATSATTAAGAATRSTSPTTTGGSTSGSPASGAKGESAVPTPAKPSKPKLVIHYLVSAQFGVVPAPPAGGGPQEAPQLKTFANLTVNEPIPAKDNPQLVYLGVVLSTGKDAVFALTGESILKGDATCMPSPTHCQAIELAPGQTERLESFEANGNAVTYELKLVSIARKLGTAAAARAHSASARALTVGRELLRQAGLSALPGLRYSSVEGLLVRVGR
jgi:hypothetical protein